MTVLAPTIEDVIQPRRIVQTIDMGFPMKVTNSTTGEVNDEHRVAIAVIPNDDGGDEPRYMYMQWGPGSGSGPELHRIARIARIDLLHPLSRELTLEDGDEITYGPSRKCGCGSRLRAFQPFGAGIRLMSTAKPKLPWTLGAEHAEA